MRGRDIAAVFAGLLVAFTVGSMAVYGLLSHRILVTLFTYFTVLVALGGWLLAGLNFAIQIGKRICTELFDWFY